MKNGRKKCHRLQTSEKYTETWDFYFSPIDCTVIAMFMFKIILIFLRFSGVPWTEHEHKMFLLGLKKLGKGDWRGIARNYVMSRTPTQVASHAQKYFIRHSATNRRKKRVSLFDIVADEVRTFPFQVMIN